MTNKATVVKGSLGSIFKADKANAEHVNINPATTIAPNGARSVPCFDDAINCSGARAKANQLGPPQMHNKCHTAAAKAITAALINNLDSMLRDICILYLRTGTVKSEAIIFK